MKFSTIKFIIAVMLPTIVSLQAAAQTPPPTIRIPVTFYDFHSNKSNPEFEQDYLSSGLRLGMVGQTLDAERKPVLGPTPFCNCGIAKWFRPWMSGDFTIPNYTNPATTTCGNPASAVNYDTAFKNVVIQDTLTFTLVPGSAGLYQYVNNAFFLLDNRGFGNEGLNHNFSFTMELHWQFQMAAGLTFQFTGDDDVWAYLNNTLAMDIGGKHAALNGSINLDTIAGLVNGQKYNFDFFYCERHTTSADILITTNLFTPPALIRIYHVTPPNFSDISNPAGNLDTAFSGTPFSLAAHLFDSTGTVRPEYDSLITWTMTDSLGTVITKLKGDSTTLVPLKAYGIVNLTAMFQNPADPNAPVVVKTIQVYIGPGKPNRINIQNTPVITSLQTDQKIHAITMDENTPTANLYAVLRDSAGNYIDSANSASWRSSDISYATVSPASKQWQGIVTKIRAGVVLIIASSPGVVSDTVVVTLVTPPPSLIRIYHVTPPNFSDISNPAGNLDTAFSGTPFNLAAHLFDSSGTLRSEYDSLITWTMTDTASLGTVITKLKGDSTTLVPAKAYGIVNLTATFKNPADPNAPAVVKTIQVYIGPGKPDHIDIQNTPVISSLRSDQGIDSITMNESTSQYSNLFAVLRDSFGNYVDSANNATWKSTDTSIATVVPGSKNWQGIVTKVKGGKIFIIASSPGVIPDTVAVTLLARKIESFVAATPAHNPAGPKNPIQDQNIINFYHTVLQNSGAPATVNGALVGIQSRVPLLPRTNGSSGNAASYGDAVVYDAVGNVVARDIHVYYVATLDSTHVSYGIYWDCHNQYGRWVGNGTYLIVISTTDSNNKTTITSRKIGFSR
ncbi:MAG: fibro-slime domain-containing protein [Chitinivibrionales bacterium]